jgi:O-antigen biosynthesis protein
LHAALVENKSSAETSAETNAAEPRESLHSSTTTPISGTNPTASSPHPGTSILLRIRASVPRAWVPVAQRGLACVGKHLPSTVRARMHRLLGSTRRDMGDIERDYPAWIARYDRIDADATRQIMADIAGMAHLPLISILMPVFDPQPDHLVAAIGSVRDQFYPRWELCISDDASTDPAVAAILRDAAACDQRIRLVRRDRNGHISAASNTALALAAGTFVALLDHDDVLPPHALHEVAARIVAQPDVDIIYSDEDHIDDGGRRSHPYFKPDWNPDLMLGQNLISHLGVYRRSLVQQIGGFRAGFEGSQDYDLALRIVARSRGDRIVHIPKVLYHWRQGAADRTFSEAAHDRCVQNGRRAVHDFVTADRPGARAEPSPLVPDWTRVAYPVPIPAPLVSVIVSSDAPPNALFAGIERLLDRTDYPVLEVLLAAGRDHPGDTKAPTLPDRLAKDQRVRCVARHDPSPTNTAADEARGSLLLLLNAHLVPNDAGWLEEMVSHAIRPGVGAVGAKLLSPNGTVRHAGIAVCEPGTAFTPFVGRRSTQTGYFGHLQLTRTVTAVSGTCLMVGRQAFLAVGGLDEVALPAAFSDVDLCLKLARIGYRTVWTPYAELTLRDDDPRQLVRTTQCGWAAARMRERWGHTLDADRYWSPNLAADPIEVRLAFPPRSGKIGSQPAGRVDAEKPRQCAGPRAAGTV